MSDIQAAEYSLRILWSAARWVEDRHGAAALESIAQEAGVLATDFDGSTRWVSHEQFEKILAGVRELAGTDDLFCEACAYRFEESYGALRYMLWALSPRQLYEATVKVAKLVTTVGRFETLRSERSAFHVRYYSKHPESRLMCLSRQVQWVAGPSMWGLPPARLEEHGCIAHGAEYCEYRLRWFDGWRILPMLIGLALGIVIGGVVQTLQGGVSAWFALPVLGAALGHVFELRRMHRLNLKLGNEMNTVLRELGQAEAETRSEIVALHQRQRDWTRLVEQQVAERTTTLERVVDGLDSLQKSRVTTIRGFSHDLRNPLFVVRGNTQFLRERVKDGEEGEALRDMEVAAGQIEAMLTKLMEVATQDPGFVRLAPKMLAVAPLAETFRRRLKALVHGRDIKVSVFCTREAPDSLEIDHLVFDRIVDNILTNAAKYTHRGSILLELSGMPAPAFGDGPPFLTLKLSDTGQGIPPELVERIFRPRAAGEATSPQSYGIGLSSVVRLLAQIGGRLDVMSKPGVGTTFWAHFPCRPPDFKKSPGAGDDNLESIITRVVTIRKAEGS